MKCNCFGLFWGKCIFREHMFQCLALIYVKQHRSHAQQPLILGIHVIIFIFFLGPCIQTSEKPLDTNSSQEEEEEDEIHIDSC